MTDASHGTSWVYSEKLEYAFRKVRDIQEFVRTYVISPDKIPVSIEDVQWAVEQKYGLKIRKELVDFEAQHIRGMMERYEDGTANVFVREYQDANKDINLYWHRFITLKEIVHLGIDEKEDWNPDGCFTLDELIKENGYSGINKVMSETQSEHLAEIAAIELLYPFEFRASDIASGKSVMQLSHEYQVPPYVIARALSPNHMKMARAVWNEIRGHGLGGLGSSPTG
ncbi:hypothetical protein [Asticcacaulis endophyticus]|uniref:Uncharacterized protein n=1 Tax=Asticcacaulis endophyticus TaxID=1395890 RepID=A0A918PUK8_9CAUL|nr:hypothetical protein [Asticcacaulis endophyticus]GGZ23238.1 hypothetical protein GCM10011273_05230 [Asticcacaulis endophyticus]